MGGGGGSTSIGSPYSGPGNRNWPAEQPSINQGYDFNIGQYNQFTQQNPLLRQANQGALGFFQGLPGMLGQLGSYNNQLSGLGQQIGGLVGNYGKFLGPNSALSEAYRETIDPMLRSGGALTPESSRDVSQQTRAIQAAQGTAHGNAALGTELLNREQYQQQRFNQALGQSQGVLGQQAGASGAVAGLRGQQAGILGQKAGLLSQKQGLQTGGLNQLLGTLGGGTSAFGGLTNPILGYLGNLFQGNQQTQIAGAQINAQQKAAEAGKAGSTAGGAISAIGSILPMLAMFSDERTKTKLKDTGLESKEGIPLKTFEYKTNPGVRFLGATAQEIEKKLPSAVFTDPRSGLKVVDVTQFPMIQLSATKPAKAS